MFLMNCGGGGNEEKAETASTPPGKVEDEVKAPAVEKEEDQDVPMHMKNKGIGPVKSVELGELDKELVAEGEKIYNMYCIACHKVNEDYLGPAPKGILDRRSPEWVMNMILNTEEMNKKDSIAIELVKNSNGAIMVSMGLKEEQARAILEYFRTL